MLAIVRYTQTGPKLKVWLWRFLCWADWDGTNSWVSTSAMAPHIAGGYSFNGAVRQDPFSSKPMAELRGSSLHTRHWWRAKIMQGMLRSRSCVGLGDGAPSSPWAKRHVSTSGCSCRVWTICSFQMLGEVGFGGGAGCSSRPQPPVMISSMKACNAKIRSSFPTHTWQSSLSCMLKNPQSSSALLTGRGPGLPLSSWCSLAAVHVSQGGPATNATTLRSRIAPRPVISGALIVSIAVFGVDDDVHGYYV